MGMSAGQMRAPMLVDLAPAASLAAAVGTTVGAGIPLLLGDALTTVPPR